MKLPYFVLAGVLATAVALPVIGCAQQTPTGPDNTTTTTQGGVPGAHGHRGGMMGLLKSLNLTQDQQTKIKAITEAYRQAHPRGSQPDPQARKQMMDQVMAVLTPDQQAQLKAKMQTMRQHRQHEGAENGTFRPDASPSPSPNP